MSTTTATRPHEWTWSAPTGRRFTGAQIADHLASALAVLERDGWDPTYPDPFAMFEALGGSVDLQRVAGRVLEFVLCSRTGAQAVYFDLWEAEPERTFAEVRDLMVAAEAVAREYGPAGVA